MDGSMEESEAYKAGMRDQRLNSLEEGLQGHQEQCEARSSEMWSELKSHTKMIYIGFGSVIVLEAVIAIIVTLFSGVGTAAITK